MKYNNKSLGLQMVKNSRPQGKSFKNKKNLKRSFNSVGFKFALENKNDSKQEISEGHSKSKPIENVNNRVPPFEKPVSDVSRGANVNTEKESITNNLSKKDDLSKKRKLDQVTVNASSNSKIPKNDSDSNSITAHQSNSVVEGNAGPKKKKRHKKKKKKTTGAVEDNQYKPVWSVKNPSNISGNWKNLKDIIAKQDQDEAEKRKGNEKNNNRFKKDKDMGGDEQQFKKRRKMTLNKMMEEQKKETENYVEHLKRKSLKSKKQKGAEESDIWFDNVDPILLGEEHSVKEEQEENEDEDESEQPSKGVDYGDGKAVAIDCEMVGVGLNGKDSMLARVSIVNQYCRVLYDKFVKPQEPVVDYRTEFSGIRPKDIENGHDFKKVQAEVAKILEGKILVGHGVDNDLRVLFLQHPRSRIRDTARYKPFKRMFRGFTPKLKMLTKRIVGADIQCGEHDSVQDAQAVMRIYTVHRKKWDEMKKKVFDKPKKKKKAKEEAVTE